MRASMRWMVLVAGLALATACGGGEGGNADVPPTETVDAPEDVQGAPRLSVSPTSVAFSAVQPRTTAERLVTVANTGSAPLELTGFVLQGDKSLALQAAGQVWDATAKEVEQAFEPAVVVPVDGSLGLTVRFTPMDATSAAATLTLRSNDPDAGEAAVVELVGNPPAPCLEVTPKQVSFAAAAGAAEQTLTLTSCGQEPLTITGLALDASSAAVFSLDLGGLGGLPAGTSALTEQDDPVVLASGTSGTVAVRFDPDAGGAAPAQGLVRIASDHAIPLVIVQVAATN